jgi:hypothetical protein
MKSPAASENLLLNYANSDSLSIFYSVSKEELLSGRLSRFFALYRKSEGL